MQDFNKKDSKSLTQQSTFDSAQSRSQYRALDEILKRRGQLTTEETFKLLEACLIELSQLHSSGILHRNIRPANIVLNDENFEHILLIDRGFNALDSKDLTAIRYSSPEILGNIEGPITASSDIYSLGVVFTEVLTGINPIRGNSLREIVIEQMVTKIPDVRLSGAKVPRAFAEVLLRMMMKDPEARYQSTHAIMDDIAKIKDQLSKGVLDPAITIGHSDIRSTLAEPSLTGFENQISFFESCLSDLQVGNGRMIFLEAESGGGKSRVLEEIKIRAQSNGTRIFQGQGTKETVEHPYESLDDIVTVILNTALQDEKFSAELRKDLAAYKDSILQTFPKFSAILGERSYLDVGPESMGEARSLEMISALFKSLGTIEKSALIVIDDGQWADHLSLKLVEKLSNEQLKYVSIIFSFRGEEVPADHLIRNLKGDHTHYIKLEPFNFLETERFAKSMTGPLPKSAIQHLFKVSRGNPFLIFAELQAMVSNGTLSPTGEGWGQDTSFHTDQDLKTYSNVIPKNLLGHLEEEILTTLKQAAVIGKKFSLLELQGLTETNVTAVEKKLAEAERKHLVVRTDGSYVFFHDKIREALLQDVDDSFKMNLHLKLAQKLDANDPNNVFGLAYHLDAAEEHVNALSFAIRAGDMARERSALELSEQYFNIARKGITDSTETSVKLKIFENLSELYLLQGKYAEADETLAEVELLSNSTLKKIKVQSKKAELLFKQGRLKESIEILEETLELEGKKRIRTQIDLYFSLFSEIFIQIFHRLGFKTRIEKSEREFLISKIYVQLGYAYYFTDTFRSIWALFKLLNHSERLGPTSELAQAYSNYGVFFLYIPFDRGALWAINKSLQIRSRLKDLWGEGQSLHILGSVHYVASRFDESIKVCKEARKRLKATGDHWEYNDAHCIEAMSMYRLGNLNEALKTSKEIYRNADLIGDAHSCAFALSVWASSNGGDVPEEFILKQLELLKSDLMSRSAVVEAQALRLISKGEFLKAIQILEEICLEVNKNKIHIEYVSGVKMLLVTAIRKHVETLHIHNHTDRSVYLKKLQKASKEALSWSRVFKNNRPVALREAALLKSLEGRPVRAIHLLDKSLQIAFSQKAKLECGRTLLELEKMDPKGEHATELRKKFPPSRMILTELNGSFEIEASERPITLALSDRFDGLLDTGRKVVLAQTADEVMRLIKEASVQLLHVDYFSHFEKSHELYLLKEFGFIPSLKTPQQIQPAVLDDLAKFLKVPRLKSALFIPVMKNDILDTVIILGHSEVSGHFEEEDGRIANFISSLASATLENIEAFQEVQNAIKIRDEFVGLSCHELRTPLTSLTLQMGMMKRQLENQEQSADEKILKIDKFIQGGEKQLTEFSRLVERLLSSTTLSSGINDLVREPVELVEMVRNIVNEMMPKFHAAHTPVVIHELGPVKGHWDPKRLIEVIQNLLNNALKYGAEKPIIINVKAEGSWAILSIKDNGIGISENDQKRIFERYSRAVSARHFGGLGLGLYLTQKIVEAHGGEITVESIVGTGSKFTVKLPLREAVLT